MCDPITIGALALGALGAGASMLQKQPKPPEMPALNPAPVVEDKPDVRLGQVDTTAKDNTTGSTAFSEKRTEAFALGNLGRSGLSI